MKNAKPILSEHADPRGKLYYWIGGERSGFHTVEGGFDYQWTEEERRSGIADAM